MANLITHSVMILNTADLTEPFTISVILLISIIIMDSRLRGKDIKTQIREEDYGPNNFNTSWRLALPCATTLMATCC